MSHMINTWIKNEQEVNKILDAIPEEIKATASRMSGSYYIITLNVFDTAAIDIVNAVLRGYTKGKSFKVLDKSTDLISNLEGVCEYIRENKLAADQYVREFAAMAKGAAGSYIDDKEKLERFLVAIDEDVASMKLTELNEE